MSRTLLIVLTLALLAVASVVVAAQRRGDTAAGSSGTKSASTLPATPEPASSAAKGVGRIVKSDAEWKKQLTAEQYRVLRHEGTEMAFTGRYWNNHAKGVYACAGCGLEVFSSETKFESGTGWPSFWQPIEKTHVSEITDSSLGMVRTEVECARCGGHLGHVFDDGPKPTGLRYCINSASLSFASGK